MGIEQRDVYFLPHPFDQKPNNHPFIVLSVEAANDYEKTFIAVMITSSQFNKDDFSFPLRDEMFENNLQKSDCHARMHLLQLCLDEEIIGRRLNRMKPFYFKQMMASIGDLVFHYNFSPLEDSD